MSENYIEYVDSDYRISGTSSNFVYKIELPKPFNRCCVISASIPKTWYLIQSGYNTFSVTEASGTRTITIPVGDYTVTNFTTVLLAQLNTGTYVYSVSRDAYTSKLTYTVSGNAGFQPIFTFPNSSVLYRMTGFEFASTNTFSADSLVSINIPFFQHTNVVFIRSNLQSSENSSLSGDILVQITAIANSQLSAITYSAVDANRQSKAINKGSNVFYFKVTDSDGFSLDLNGIPINLEIAFWFADDTNKFIKGSLLLDNLEKMKASRQL